MIEAAKAVLKAYFTAELIRSRGFVYGLLSMAMWMMLFIAPIMLFTPPGVDEGLFAGYGFTAVLVFMSYSTVTWDWAWQLRWLMRSGIFDYVVTSGRNILILYLGIVPVSLVWLAMALAEVYVLLAVLFTPPAFQISNPLLLVYGLVMLGVVLFAHSMILGATTIATGTSGPVMEILSWILPIATGGLVPLIRMPETIQVIALCTPYSYPAEIIRYYLLGTPTVLPIEQTLLHGGIYAIVFLAVSLIYFKIQLKKVFKEGPKTIGMY